MTDTIKNKNIETIYPLSDMQRSLLFHHLMNKEDQGFLHVQCSLKGKLNVDNLKKSWKAIIKRHAILRTSIHWKNIKKPLQVVRHDSIMEWSIIDWVDSTVDEIKYGLSELKMRQREEGIDFEKSPLSKITLIQINRDEYYLLWSCHHIFLDGWSSSILLKDLFAFYEAFLKNSEPKLEIVPSYKSYLNWLQKTELDEAASFWKKTFRDFKSPVLFNKLKSEKSRTPEIPQTYTTQNIILSEKVTTDLKLFAKKYHITTNSLFQGIWSLLLCRYFGNNDITFGTTVSGRSSSFPNIELMTGMFMNVLPVRFNFDDSSPLSIAFQKIQRQQQEARKFEHSTNDKIATWIDRPSESELFDSLFVFENFPWKDINVSGIAIKDFESGLTTTYPITLVVKTGSNYNIDFLVNSKVIDDKTITWFRENIKYLVNNLNAESDILVGALLEKLNPSSFKIDSPITIDETVEILKTDYVTPKNNEELQLIKIWESVLGIHPISTIDNFFDLGGKSIHALRMFTLIENEMSIKRPPTVLLENPTVIDLAKNLNTSEPVQKWKYLVPIKARGNKPPLFCIHAGGGHIFYYKPLSDFIDKERPLYGIQSSGISDLHNIIGDIEQMARAYVDEMRMVQPTGPLNVMVYCFSTAIGVEMASYLKERNEDINLIVMDSYAERGKSYLEMRLYSFMDRVLRNPFKAIKLIFSSRIQRNKQKVEIDISGSDQQIAVEKIRKVLMTAHKNYQWKNIDGSIWLILMQKEHKRLNGYIVASWKKIVKQSVNVIYSGGTHYNIFEVPEVKYAAKCIEKCINEKDNTTSI